MSLPVGAALNKQVGFILNTSKFNNRIQTFPLRKDPNGSPCVDRLWLRSCYVVTNSVFERVSSRTKCVA